MPNQTPHCRTSRSTTLLDRQSEVYAHLGQLGRRSSSNLLDSKGEELLLELTKLLGEVGLVLGNKLVSANGAGRRHGELEANTGRERKAGESGTGLQERHAGRVWSRGVWACRFVDREGGGVERQGVESSKCWKRRTRPRASASDKGK